MSRRRVSRYMMVSDSPPPTGLEQTFKNEGGGGCGGGGRASRCPGCSNCNGGGGGGGGGGAAGRNVSR